MTENKSLRSLMAENPAILVFLGACPALGATTDLRAALGMGCAVLLVMVLSGLVLGLLKKVLPDNAKISAAILVVAGFASVVQLLMNAFLPSVYQMLGLYLTVAAVDILILTDSEQSCELSLGKGLMQGLLTGLVFAALLLATALIREVFGAGSIAGIDIPGLSKYNVPVLTQPAGGFIVLSILAAVINRAPIAAGSFHGFAMQAAGLPVEDVSEEIEKEEDSQ